VTDPVIEKTAILFVVSAPSGAGKTSLLRALVPSDPRLVMSVSHATRPMRPGEQDGVDYHFVDVAAFERMVADGAFLEHARVFDNYYRAFLISDLCRSLPTPTWSRTRSGGLPRLPVRRRGPRGPARASPANPTSTIPSQVARILAEMHMDHQSIMAAILHDVIEDTHRQGADGARVRRGGGRTGRRGQQAHPDRSFESNAEAQAENFRKMMLAMARDIRVILVKLADRLHNMRTLGVMRPDKRRRIARETLDIYAPIANRLGMNSIRLELEELGFQALYPCATGCCARR
jgi:hypothetical protein